ncbi:hypothetical protein [[Clostridium] polysaccharolyticum]|uniref:Uncharacterized protein n=1 Tax=[Clostridium] polysaccharolyticum TaxID=29364 RepID=A0A1H9YK20_9FIRM|nr:hypothetical protein [[Clostridium] polysaccharolyticum]SES69411.1 hypothetical protein SAMN04487772_10262 [[Clostridium] polysaccharolyticum]
MPKKIDTAEKIEFLLRAAKIWDMLSEREKGRLEGQLYVYEVSQPQTA